jgi:hypothetical protein
MRWQYWIAMITAALLLAAGCTQQRGASAPPPTSDAQQAASNALATLQKLVTEQNYKALGFTSLDEVKSATLAKPLAQYDIGLDRLREYQVGKDPNALLTASSETIYPVTVAGQVRSSVTVVKKETGYTTASFGNANIVKALSLYRGANVSEAFAVRISALGMYFLGNRVETRLMLTPVVEDNRLPFRIGVAVPAEDLLKAIIPLAQAYNGLPT